MQVKHPDPVISSLLYVLPLVSLFKTQLSISPLAQPSLPPPPLLAPRIVSITLMGSFVFAQQADTLRRRFHLYGIEKLVTNSRFKTEDSLKSTPSLSLFSICKQPS